MYGMMDDGAGLGVTVVHNGRVYDSLDEAMRGKHAPDSVPTTPMPLTPVEQHEAAMDRAHSFEHLSEHEFGVAYGAV